MADMKQIHDFAVKWCDKFRDQNINYIELVDHYMADDCDTLGFEMDCGHAFSEKYGNAANNHEALDRIIDDVTDIPLLGSAIYSHRSTAKQNAASRNTSFAALPLMKDIRVIII